MSRIYLWGFMGSGKTTVGKLLADQLGYEFLDLDKKIELVENSNITEIFTNKGEEYFRLVENATLKSLVSSTDKVVVATGGGTPCFFDHADIMNKTGVTVYLHVSEDVLRKRLMPKRDPSRPMLIKNNWLDVMDLYQKRQIYYQTAQIIINNDQGITQCVQKIVKYLDTY